MVRTQIQLTEKQSMVLKRLAAQQQVSMAAIIRQAIDRIVDTGPAGERRKIREKAAAATGRFRSGVKDLSANHDGYFSKAVDK